MVFSELMANLPQVSEERMAPESLLDDSLFFIDSSDPWYGDILVYLQTQHFRPKLSEDNHRRIHHQAQHYLIVGDALYR